MVRKILIATAYIALLLGANAASSEDGEGLLQGEMRDVIIHDAPQLVSQLPFVEPGGDEGTLAEYGNRFVVLNFWATWCAPCREEMPSLQNLQAQLRGAPADVVTIATGRNPEAAIRRFFEQEGITTLPQYRDVNQRIAREMGVFGLPVTVLINSAGQEVARLTGDAHWDSPEALALINYLMSR